MGGDFTRWTFDPLKNPAGVLMQQGRVQLDADWNEMVALFERRLRAETTDLVGPAVVPRETATGFAVAASTGNQLRIGRGRMYVDGLLAENHGKLHRADGDTTDPPLEVDPTLVEVRGVQDTDYTQQPYLPSPPDLTKDGPGPHLVYLDVWRREVTALEDPALVDQAVGVDTAVRWQTVWQVRVLANVPATMTCANADLDPRWLETIRPSNARLTTSVSEVAPPVDPCAIVPNGGYGGLENQLYRVEIHRIEPPAAASISAIGPRLLPGLVDLAIDTPFGFPPGFLNRPGLVPPGLVHPPGVLPPLPGTGRAYVKWSRDNGTVATAVQEIKPNGTGLVLVWTRRDWVFAFAAGDWVEITDDRLELQGAPGVMAQIAQVDPDTRTITLSTALPADQFDTANPTGLHTRIRRWDHKGPDVNSEGLIPVTLDTPITLEQGIQVTFSADGGGMQFKPGDYWIFAARTADSSVETLTKAPPRGVHHHYARLALVTFPDTVTDCRTFWPPQMARSECTVWVSADDHNCGRLTIQGAIDQVRDCGGRICLGPGVFNLGAQPLNLKAATGVRLAGRGLNTVLMNAGPAPSLIVDGSVGAAVERMTFVTVAGSTTEGIAISARNCSDLRVEGCAFLQHRPGVPHEGRGTGGILLRPGYLDPPVGTAPANRAPAILLGGVLVDTLIRDNLVVAGSGIANEEVFVVAAAPGVPPPESVPATGGGGILRLPPSWTLGRAAIPIDLGPARLASGGAIGLTGGGATGTLGGGAPGTTGGVAGGGGGAAASGGPVMRFAMASTAIESASAVRLAGGPSSMGIDRFPPTADQPPPPSTTPAPSISPTSGPTGGTSPIAPDRYLMTAGLVIEANLLLCRFRALSFDGMCFHIGETRIAGNRVEGETDSALVFMGMVSQASRLDIRDNSLRSGADGIVVGTDRSRIRDNDMTPFPGGKGGSGVVLKRGLDPGGMHTVEVIGNRIDDMAVRGISLQGHVGDAAIEHNRIEGTGLGGIVMEAGSSANTLLVARNRLVNIAPSTNDGGRALAAINLLQATRADVEDNVLIGIAPAAAQGLSRTGINVAGCASVRIVGNEVVRIGPAGDFLGDAAGIIVLTPFDRVDVLDNVVRRSDQPPAAPTASSWHGISVTSAAEQAPQILPGGINVVRFGTTTAFLTATAVAMIQRGTEIVSVRGNLIDGYGAVPLLAVTSGGSCAVSENRCTRSGSAAAPPVALDAAALVVSSNVVHGEPVGADSISLHQDRPSAVVANVVSGPIRVGSNELGSPWAPLNLTGA